VQNSPPWHQIKKNELEHWRNTKSLILRLQGRAVVERESASMASRSQSFPHFLRSLRTTPPNCGRSITACAAYSTGPRPIELDNTAKFVDILGKGNSDFVTHLRQRPSIGRGHPCR
jgi:hypothetical protein